MKRQARWWKKQARGGVKIKATGSKEASMIAKKDRQVDARNTDKKE